MELAPVPALDFESVLSGKGAESVCDPPFVPVRVETPDPIPEPFGPLLDAFTVPVPWDGASQFLSGKET